MFVSLVQAGVLAQGDAKGVLERQIWCPEGRDETNLGKNDVKIL